MRRGHFLGDTQGLSQYPFAYPRPETGGRADINLAAKQIFQLLLQLNEAE